MGLLDAITKIVIVFMKDIWKIILDKDKVD
jgi:hypothetical protein